MRETNIYFAHGPYFHIKMMFTCLLQQAPVKQSLVFLS